MADISKTRTITYYLELDQSEMTTLIRIFSDAKTELYRKLPEGMADASKEDLMAQIYGAWEEN